MKNRLRDLRMQRGIAQKDVAAHLGMSAAGYSHLESGRRKLSDEALVKLSALLGCTADDILGIADAAGLDTASDPGCARLKAVVDAAIDRMPSAERAALQRLLTGYFALSDAGREKLAEESEMMVRSGMYARFGRAKAFSDGDPGPRRETA